MTEDQALQKLIEHHMLKDGTERFKNLGLEEFREEQKRRHWDSYHGYARKGFWVDYRLNNKVRLKIDGVEFYCNFNDFVDKLYEELHFKQLTLF